MSTGIYRRAAQYLRMSTDMQQYSIENQKDVIALYAARHRYAIVRSYEDAAKSGVRLTGRPALKALLDDVSFGRAEFDTVLVYDVSRWGRFQDSDESAHYEYICKQAGIQVHYCAEQFANDGSLTATVIKNIKRAMAGEYSRELSVKVHAGQSKLASRGFYFGASAGFGLRRVLVDERGVPKMELAPGQRKSLHTEHVILVPGPPEEVRIVNYVYDQYIDKRRATSAIVRSLNRMKIPRPCGKPWNSQAVDALLTNEKYMGTAVYNRTSRKLGGKCRRNPSAEWVRKLGAFEPVVSAERFRQARLRREANKREYTATDVLDFLTALWCGTGKLSRDSIDAAPTGPSSKAVQHHFGSLTNAFRMIGFTTGRLASRQALRDIRMKICREIAAGAATFGGSVIKPSGYNCQLRVNGDLNVTVVVGRLTPFNISRNQNQWRFGYRCRKKPDILVVARVENGEVSVRDYYILPFLFLPHGSWLTVSGRNYRRLEPFHSPTLTPIFRMLGRTSLNLAADAQ